MDSDDRKVEMFFFPFVGGGHLIPMIDLARLFATHGVKSTIVTVPNYAAVFNNAVDRDRNSGLDIHLHALQLPPGEELHAVTAVDLSAPLFTDTSVLQDPLTQLLLHRRPDCIVTDTFHRWAADAVAVIRIPRVIFNAGKGIRMDRNSIGQVVNSFYELEPDYYAQFYRKEMGQKAWIIGPVSLCNRNVADKADRGQKAAIDEHFCLNWLDSKKPNSVLYVSFGSLARLEPTQLIELAHGLEASNCSFIWVVRNVAESGGERERGENWLPEGFEERMSETNRGLIIKGWAPQLLILEHIAIAGFMTHCGWNSTLEGVCAGVPMITWSLSAEQFYNEELVTDVLKIGVRVGSEEWASWNMERNAVVGREKVEAAVKRLLGGSEEEEMRRRAKELAEKARRAVEEGGSSFNDVEALIEELKRRRKTETDSAGD